MIIDNELLKELIDFRKEMHRFPEISENEYNTAGRIKSYLVKNTTAELIDIHPTVVCAKFKSNYDGPAIMLRADTDALPIQEVNEFEYRSVFPGVSHKCGHDGHTAIMLGVAVCLGKMNFRGSVFLLFQPAEENGMGAELVLKSEYFKCLQLDFVYALHNLPGFEKNAIVLRENNFNANVKSLIIKLKGKTAHAAEPERGHNPALAVAKCLQYCDGITANFPQRDDFFLITPVHLVLGDTAYGISADYAEIHLTIRSWDLSLFEAKVKDLMTYMNAVASSENLKCNYEWTQIFYANINHEVAVRNIRSAAKSWNATVVEMKHPFKWGEDFGLFTQKYKGAMFGIGAGVNCPALHNPDYDFPDEIISAGITQFINLLEASGQS